MQSPQIFFQKTPQFLKKCTPQSLLKQKHRIKKRTKTICTIGPKCQSVQNVGKLIDEGMNVARLNFSHGNHETHKIPINNIKQALKSRPHTHVSILLDTKGPQIRTGNNASKQPIQLQKGQLLQITTDYDHLGTSKRIACSYKDLPKSTQIGRKILIADGGISTQVVKIQNNIVTVEVLNHGKIGSKKNMCLPGCVINLPTIGEVDKNDIINFGVVNKIDFIAISFARYKKDLDDLRKLLVQKDPQRGHLIQLISKIQNHEAILNLDEIIQGSDGIMVARGDLGMQVPLQKVVILQKYITQRTINAGKFVITATQMIQSMQTKPRPTRAQISDITNSILDLADANMTSGETANGQFPTQSVRLLKSVAQQVQACNDYKRSFEYRKSYSKDMKAVGIISFSFQTQCDFIFIETNSVKLVHRISTLRPKAFIIVCSNDANVKGALAIDFGVYVYQKQYCPDPISFFKNYGQSYGFISKQNIRIMALQTQGDNILGSKIIQLN